MVVNSSNTTKSNFNKTAFSMTTNVFAMTKSI